MALLDTGASLSAVSEAFAKRLKLPIKSLPALYLISADNQILPTLGYVDININLQGLHVPFEFIVIPGLCNDVILGMNFMSQSRAIINTNRNSVSFYDDLLVLPLLTHFSATANLARVAHKCIRPPQSETAITVTLPLSCAPTQGTDVTRAVIIEALPFDDQHSFLVSRSLAAVRDKVAIIRVLNPTTHSIVLRKLQAIASTEIINKYDIDVIPHFVNTILRLRALRPQLLSHCHLTVRSMSVTRCCSPLQFWISYN